MAILIKTNDKFTEKLVEKANKRYCFKRFTKQTKINFASKSLNKNNVFNPLSVISYLKGWIPKFNNHSRLN